MQSIIKTRVVWYKQDNLLTQQTSEYVKYIRIHIFVTYKNQISVHLNPSILPMEAFAERMCGRVIYWSI